MLLLYVTQITKDRLKRGIACFGSQCSEVSVHHGGEGMAKQSHLESSEGKQARSVLLNASQIPVKVSPHKSS